MKNNEDLRILINDTLLQLALYNIDDNYKINLEENIIKLKDIYQTIEDSELQNLAIKILFAYEINEFIKFKLLEMLNGG